MSSLKPLKQAGLAVSVLALHWFKTQTSLRPTPYSLSALLHKQNAQIMSAG